MNRILLGSFAGLVIAFLLLPLVVVVMLSFSDANLMRFPPQHYSLQSYFSIPPEFFQAAMTSLLVASGSTVLAVSTGVPAALALARRQSFAARPAELFFLSPLIVPTVVIAVGGLQCMTLLWHLLGIDLTNSYSGMILAHASFTTAFVIRATMAALANFDTSIEEASINLGATPAETFFRITLPLILPGIAAGAVFAFLASFDELPIALFLGGPDVTTLPVKLFVTIEDSLDTWIMSLAALVIVASLVIALLLQALAGRSDAAPRV